MTNILPTGPEGSQPPNPLLQQEEHEENLFEEIDTHEEKITNAASENISHSLAKDVAEGLLNSKFTLAPLTASGFAIGGLFFVFLAIHGLPPAWMIAAVGVGGYAAGFFGQLPFGKSFQKLQFECSALSRLLQPETNYNVISMANQEGEALFTHELALEDSEAVEIGEGALILGSLPNRLNENFENFIKRENLGAVLSVNEDWENTPVGLSIPIHSKAWEDFGIKREFIEAKDHQLLSLEQLDKGADFINSQISSGKTVYVHCRAGVGRSAMMVAAYLIKYKVDKFFEESEEIEGQQKQLKEPEGIEDLKKKRIATWDKGEALVVKIENCIIKNRPNSTIRKKRKRLVEWVKARKEAWSQAVDPSSAK